MEILLVAVAIGIIALVLAMTKPQETTPEDVWPFYAKKAMSKPEQILYHRLVEALPDKIILAQVQLSRMIGVKKGHDLSWFNRINRMSTDFVVCRKDFSIVSAIELDDKTHDKKERKIADQKKDKALSAAGIPVIRWSTKQIPDTPTIQCHFKGESA